MGRYSISGTYASGTFAKALSDDIAKKYAGYINKLDLKDSKNQELTLKKSSSGIYVSGAYAEYLKAEVGQPLSNFLKDTEFPYTATSVNDPSGATQQSGSKPSGRRPSGAPSNNTKNGNNSESGDKKPSGSMPNGGAGAPDDSQSSGRAYETIQNYIRSLNENGTWVKYNARANTAKITGLKASMTHCKEASKDAGAFDGLTRQQTENNLFATTTRKNGHFDSTMNNLLSENASKYAKLKNYKSSYASAFVSDLKQKDAQGSMMATRLDMYDPMYHLSNYYKGYNTTKVAEYWRIRTGINQDDTALTIETDLTLALKQDSQVKNVNFATVWGQGHTEAEGTGNSETNFIEWINRCLRN